MVSASQYPQSINVDPGLELRLGREVENGGDRQTLVSGNNSCEELSVD